MFKSLGVLSMGTVAAAAGKEAFVFLGSTGDNALRPAGVWDGLFEAHAGGVFDQAGGVDIFCAANSPSTEDSLKQSVLASLTPLYADLKKNTAWKCLASGGCEPQDFVNSLKINIHQGFDSCAQAASMTESLKSYTTIRMYMSIPPKVFGEWASCAATNWGKDRVQVAAEKPFGTSLENADTLHDQITKAIPEASLHLVDHWLSFFMNKNIPMFRGIVEKKLGISFNRTFIENIVVTEFEVRGLEGRGGFFDGVGQVRDMVQSHLLQVLALTLEDPSSTAKDQKFDILNATTAKECLWGQYDGFLLEPKLGYHASYADSTYCDVLVNVDMPEWYSVPMHIVTGKDFGLLKYTVEIYQRDGPGKLTYEIGKEETGIAGIKVENWPLKDASPFKAPVGGFDSSKTITVIPQVNMKGNGYILSYHDVDMYFPSPYSGMLAALLTGDFAKAFATYAECRRGWEIITMTSTSLCMDPPPELVPIYQEPAKCGQTPPDVCWQVNTVKDVYDVTFACTAEHDVQYKNVSLYQAKCHPSSAK